VLAACDLERPACFREPCPPGQEVAGKGDGDALGLDEVGYDLEVRAEREAEILGCLDLQAEGGLPARRDRENDL